MLQGGGVATLPTSRRWWIAALRTSDFLFSAAARGVVTGVRRVVLDRAEVDMEEVSRWRTLLLCVRLEGGS